MPFTEYRPDHRAGVELAAIDPHRAGEATADIERRLDNGVAGEARRDRFEISHFPGRAAAGHSGSSSSDQVGASSMRTKPVRLHVGQRPLADNPCGCWRQCSVAKKEEPGEPGSLLFAD